MLWRQIKVESSTLFDRVIYCPLFSVNRIFKSDQAAPEVTLAHSHLHHLQMTAQRWDLVVSLGKRANVLVPNLPPSYRCAPSAGLASDFPAALFTCPTYSLLHKRPLANQPFSVQFSACMLPVFPGTERGVCGKDGINAENSSAEGLQHMVTSAGYLLTATHRVGAWPPTWALSLTISPVSLCVPASSCLPNASSPERERLQS